MSPTVLVAQLVKNLPAVQETRVRFLGWEDPLEKEMAIHCSILAWKISWTEGCSPWGRKASGTTDRLTLSYLQWRMVALFGKSSASRSLWIRSELIMGDPFWVRKPLSILGCLSEVCYRHI